MEIETAKEGKYLVAVLPWSSAQAVAAFLLVCSEEGYHLLSSTTIMKDTRQHLVLILERVISAADHLHIATEAVVAEAEQVLHEEELLDDSSSISKLN